MIFLKIVLCSQINDSSRHYVISRQASRIPDASRNAFAVRSRGWLSQFALVVRSRGSLSWFALAVRFRGSLSWFAFAVRFRGSDTMYHTNVFANTC